MSELVYEIRETQADEAGAILEIARNVGVFNAEEVATVDELLRDRFTKGAEASGYNFLSCYVKGKLVGFACFGPTPLTRGTYDLYWIAVHPSHGRHGLGGVLLTAVAQEIKSRGGRLVLAETSGRPEYEKTHRFYERHGYRREAVIADFYSPGDDLFIYIQRLASRE